MTDRATGLDRRRITLMLRSVIIATSAYLVLSGEDPFDARALTYVVLFALSNLGLALLPRRYFELPQFGAALLLFDTGVILFALAWRSGLSQELLLVYFFTLFLTTVGDSLGSIAAGSGLVIGLYGYWMVMHGQQEPEAWLRLPFFFLVAIFYASLTEQLKRERRRRALAEQESRHLRFLLDLAGVFSESHATHEFVTSIGNFVEEACPNLRCRVVLAGCDDGVPANTIIFPLRAHDREYGVLEVNRQNGGKLNERETWVCQMVSHAAAGALYAAEQSSAARAAAEAKEQFLAIVSHELRTPLHAILGYSEILDAMISNVDEELRESVQRLRANALRLQDLVEQVVGFAELRAGYRSVRVECVNLRELIMEIVPIVKGWVDGRPVEFEVAIDSGADTLVTDRRRLRQVILCLLNNAVKFTDQGRLRLSTTVGEGGGVAIRISDTGIGMAKEDLAKLFEAFRQLDSSITRRYGGLGIGLAFAREVLGLLGGEMTIESEPGKGTTVTVWLPASAGREKRLLDEKKAPVLLSHTRVACA